MACRSLTPAVLDMRLFCDLLKLAVRLAELIPHEHGTTPPPGFDGCKHDRDSWRWMLHDLKGIAWAVEAWEGMLNSHLPVQSLFTELDEGEFGIGAVLIPEDFGAALRVLADEADRIGDLMSAGDTGPAIDPGDADAPSLVAAGGR